MSLHDLATRQLKKERTHSIFNLNTKLRAEIKPIIINFINVYNYVDMGDFSEAHKEEIYGHLLACKSIDMNLINELICWDEFLQGVCLGYIEANKAKTDLLERLDDVLFDTLDHWVQYEYQLVVESRARPVGDDLHVLLWGAEAIGRASDHNSTYFDQVRSSNE